MAEPETTETETTDTGATGTRKTNIIEKLAGMGVNAELVTFETPVTTADDCVKLGIPADKLVKTILLILDEQKPLLIALLGGDSIDFKKIREMTGIRNVRTARPDEVKNTTGYEVGGVIPFIQSLETILDSRAAQCDIVYVGGGDHYHLVKTTPAEILKFARQEIISRDAQL